VINRTAIVQFDGDILKFCQGYRSYKCVEIFDLNYFIKQNVVVCNERHQSRFLDGFKGILLVELCP